MLCKSSNKSEILWNFSRLPDSKGRLTLKQNPHFYGWLPTLPEQYGGNFQIAPIGDFLHLHSESRIHVLTDNPGRRVYLETAQNTRAFGNVWVANNAIIFKGSILSVISFSQSLTSEKMSVESSRVKVSLERPFRTRPTCGVLRNPWDVLPLRQYFRHIGIVRFLRRQH